MPACIGMHQALRAVPCLLLLMCLSKTSWMVRQGCRVPSAEARLDQTLSVQHTKPVTQSCQPLHLLSPPAARICSLPLQDAVTCYNNLQPAISVSHCMPQPLHIPQNVTSG